MKVTLGCLRKADTDYKLIEAGDRVAIGISGGKDSLLLLHALSLYRKFSHKDFTIMAFTVSMGLEPFDLSEVRALCEKLDIPYIVRETEIGKVIFEYRKEKNPCALCAKMRRGVLSDLCNEYGCNKLALGHHREDAVETLVMSLLYEGRFRTFQPKSYLSRSNITVIRPLIYLPESHVQHMTRELALPVVKSPCPADGETKREEIKQLMNALQKRFPDAPERFLHALQHDEQYNLWQKDPE